MTQCRVVLLCVALALATVALYWPVRSQQFINFDDDLYVTENAHVRSGVTWESARWAFQTTHGTHWLPLTWLSHMLDCQLFGVDAGASKMVNVALHVASTLLLFLVLKRATTAFWPSLLVAVLFALHPLRVESVAWVAERKDVLSTFFWMLALWAYVRYAERPGAVRYGWVALFFILGLMAKPMVITLPFVLLLLDFWPLGRTRWATPARQGLSTLFPRRLVLEKLPLFGLAAGFGAAQYCVTHSAGAIVTAGTIPVGLRVTNALMSYGRYLGKMIWPRNLAVFYPFPASWPLSLVGMVTLLLVSVSIVVVWAAKRCPYLLVGWVWYLGTLVPVIGLVQVGTQSMADRFTYIPSVGIFIGVAWVIADVIAKRPGLRYAAIIGVAAAVVACAAVTRLQLQYWKDSVTVFRRALAVTSGNFLAEGNLGVALCNQNQIEEGVMHLQEAIQLSPRYAYAHGHLGRAYFSLGKADEAIYELRQAVALDPGSASGHNNLGTALAREHRPDEAAIEFAKALQLEPDSALAWSNLGGVLVTLGRTEEALRYLREAVRLRPDNADAHDNLGVALAGRGELAEALAQYEQALRLQPDHADAHYNLGILLAQQGRTNEAVKQLQDALKTEPGSEKVRRAIGELQTAETR